MFAFVPQNNTFGETTRMWLAWEAKDMRKPKTFGSGGKLERAHEKDVDE